jgi:O-antigen/teichoic acid export membrane protein
MTPSVVAIRNPQSMPFLVKDYLTRRPYLKRVAVNVSWLFFDKIVRMGLGLLVSVWLARYLGPDEFGLFSYAMALVAIGSAISVLGLDSIVVKELLIKPQDRGALLGTSIVLQFVTGILIFLILLGLVYYFKADNPVLVLITAILGPMSFLRSSEVVKYWYESQLLSKVTVRVENAVFIAFSCIKAGLIYLGFDLVAVVVAVLIESIVVASALILIYQFHGGVLSVSSFSKSRAADLISKSWPFVASSIAVMVYLRIDVVMLESYLGAAAVGNYGVATRVAEVWYFIPGIIVASVFPSIMDARNTDQILYTTRLVRLLSVLFWISIGLALTTSLASQWIVTNLFGLRYMSAAAILSVITWSSVFVFVGVASGRWFLVENLQRLLLYRTFVGAIINVILNFILIPHYGELGAAWATFASQAYANVLSNLFSKTTRPLFKLQIRAMAFPLLVLRAIKA